MVCMDHNWVVSTEEVWVATFESINDSCHFFVIDIIVLFCGEESPRMEGNWVSSICKFLTDYDT